MEFSEPQRERIAEALVSLADELPALSSQLQERAFAAYIPLVAFDQSFCEGDEERSLWNKIIIEEVKERLGSTTYALFDSEQAQGSTIYRSELLDELRKERNSRLGIGPGQLIPPGRFVSGETFYFAARRRQWQAVASPQGKAALSAAWDEAYRRFHEESVRMQRSQEMPTSESDRRFLVRLLEMELEPLGFRRLKLPGGTSQAAFKVEVGAAWLVFAVDVQRPLQTIFSLTPPLRVYAHLISRTAHVQMPLASTLLALLRGGAPYSAPRGCGQWRRGVCFHSATLSFAVPRVIARLAPLLSA